MTLMKTRISRCRLVGLLLLILRQVGDLVIADASPQGYRELARHPLLDGRSWTVPALANGCLFVRNNAGAVACYQLLQQP